MALYSSLFPSPITISPTLNLVNSNLLLNNLLYPFLFLNLVTSNIFPFVCSSTNKLALTTS